MQEFGRLMAKVNEFKSRGATGLAKQFKARAWKEYGKALHPVMDSTSPVHNKEWKLRRDWKKHGDFKQSRETRKIAPAYRDETIRRMRNMSEFIIKDKSKVE